MAVRDGFAAKDDGRDELAQLLQESRQNTRRDIWLWLYLQHYRRARLDPSTCNGTTMRSVIAHTLKRKSYLLGVANQKKDRFMLPDDCLKWIDGGERQYQWLLSRIEEVSDLRPPKGLSQELVHLTGRNHFIATLDIWDVDIADKAREIENLRKEWLKHKANDREFAWFEDKKEGARRCQCAWEWVERNDRFISKEQLPISNYQELLMYFDEAKFGTGEQKAVIRGIKQRWSRKQFDARTTDKKQVNVMLSKSVITILDELAKKHDLKRGQVLDRLITMESKQGRIDQA